MTMLSFVCAERESSNLNVLKSIKMSPDDDATQVKQFCSLWHKEMGKSNKKKNLFSLLKTFKDIKSSEWKKKKRFIASYSIWLFIRRDWLDNKQEMLFDKN